MESFETTSKNAPRWPLWALLWRTLLFGPFIMAVGTILFVAILFIFIFPPVYGLIFAMDGHYFWALSLFALWLVWLRPGGKLLRWLLQGIEWSSL